MFKRPTPRNTRLVSIFPLAAALIALAVFFVAEGAPSVSAGHKLGTPTDLAVTVASPTSVEVFWRRGGSPRTQNYRVQYREQGASAATDVDYPGSQGNHFTKTISGLMSETTYEFRIRSTPYAGHSASDWSQWAAVTLPEAPVRLVSNRGQGRYVGFLAHLRSNLTSAQSFRTGNYSEGYLLSSIEVAIDANVREPVRDNLSAEVWSNSGSNQPGVKLYDLTVPPHPINRGAVSFAAPDNATLEPSTQYWVVLYSTTINNGLHVTSLGNQHSDYGWSIGDLHHQTSDVPPTISSSWGTPGRTLVWSMTIKGFVIPRVTTADLSALTGATSADGSTFDGALTLSPAFDAGARRYRATVGNDVTHVKLTPTIAEAGATVTVEGAAVTSGAASEAIALELGDNTLTVRVTAADGSTTRDYTVTVSRPGTALVSNLGQKLYVSSIPEFGRGLGADFVYGMRFRTGSAPGGYRLSGIKVDVLSESTAEAISRFRVELWSTTSFDLPAHLRGEPDVKLLELTPPSSTSAGRLSFTAPVNTVLSPDTHYHIVMYTNKYIRIRLGTTDSAAEDAGGEPGWAIQDYYFRQHSLTVPDSNDHWQEIERGGSFRVAVQGAVVGSNANLSDLTASGGMSAGGAFSALALDPSTFAADTTSYTASVANSITHVRLTPTVEHTRKATVTVEGAAVDSGAASDAVSLDVGENALTVRVTAEDGVTTRDYTVTVTREASSNANLSGLTASAGAGGTFSALTLDPPTFAAGTTAYTATVANSITHVKLTPTVEHTGKATVTVEGTAVDGGAASEAIALDIGENALTVRVAAEDGVTTQDYTVTVTRQGSWNAYLTGLGIAGTVTRDGETFTFPVAPNPWFDPHTHNYTIRVPAGLESITFTPTWTDTAITAVVLRERANADRNTRNSNEAARTGTSGAGLTSASAPRFPAIEVLATNSDPLVHYFDLQESSLSFNGAAVDDRTFTEGGEISLVGLSEAEMEALRLPMATGGFYNVTYTATGLPEGLYMGQGRMIQGTPAARTDSPVAVTYTATDETGASVSLTFQVTVAPPVAFDADERRAFKATIFEYTVGQAERIEATLPEATGGHGTLTYGLTYWVKEQRIVDGRTITGGVEKTINDDAPGFSFDSNTRVLSSDTGVDAPSEAAFYSVDYWAEDENGARAIASNSIAVNEAPTLPAIAWQTWTVGESVSVTLPEAEGGTRVGTGIRYRLEGADLSAIGLSFNGRTRTISGTPTRTTAGFWTYTATDRNGVSAGRTLTVNILAGGSAPADAPGLTAFSAATTSGIQIVFLDWADVTGATSYVVQIIADGGTFPSRAVGVLPEEGSLTVYDSQRDLGSGKTGHAFITSLAAGDYKVRVAAANGDGSGPWSNELSFTFSVAPQQPQPGGQSDPCDNCGAEGDEGAVDQGQGQYAELIAQMYEWRNDPEWVHAKAHTDRWDRALLAFGETVADASLTPMTADEAQGFADRGWERWEPVTAALREIEGG